MLLIWGPIIPDFAIFVNASDGREKLRFGLMLCVQHLDPQ